MGRPFNEAAKDIFDRWSPILKAREKALKEGKTEFMFAGWAYDVFECPCVLYGYSHSDCRCDWDEEDISHLN